MQDQYNHLQTSEFEKAVMILLKKPALDFSRDLRSELDRHPDYLQVNQSEIAAKIEHFLEQRGIYWDQQVLSNNLEKLIREVVVRLRSFEKGSS